MKGEREKGRGRRESEREERDGEIKKMEREG